MNPQIPSSDPLNPDSQPTPSTQVPSTPPQPSAQPSVPPTMAPVSDEVSSQATMSPSPVGSVSPSQSQSTDNMPESSFQSKPIVPQTPPQPSAAAINNTEPQTTSGQTLAQPVSSQTPPNYANQSIVGMTAENANQSFRTSKRKGF